VRSILGGDIDLALITATLFSFMMIPVLSAVLVAAPPTQRITLYDFTPLYATSRLNSELVPNFPATHG